jgi:hypothetical protein
LDEDGTLDVMVQRTGAQGRGSGVVRTEQHLL